METATETSIITGINGITPTDGAPASEPATTTPTTGPAAAAEPVDITADDVFGADDHRVITVKVDEWKPGGVVYIHTPSAADKDHLEHVLLAGTDDAGKPKRVGKDEVRAYFVAMCARNSKGERIFKAEDIARLKHKSIAPMDRIYGAILDASIVTEKDVEVMAKNSGAASNDS
jgi:hypothetical protein